MRDRTVVEPGRRLGRGATRTALLTLVLGTVTVGAGLAVLGMTRPAPEPLRLRELAVGPVDPAARIEKTVANQPYRVGLGPVCLTAPGTVEITAVRTIGGSGIEVTGFSAHLFDDSWNIRPIGAEAGSLEDAGWPVGVRQTVPVVCQDSSNGTASAFAIQVERHGRQTARAQAFVLQWRADSGKTGELTIPYELSLCNADLASC